MMYSISDNGARRRTRCSKGLAVKDQSRTWAAFFEALAAAHANAAVSAQHTG
jgi:hypothetical protein